MATILNPSCIRSCVDLDAVIRQVSSLLPSCCSPHASSSVHAIGTLRTNSCQCLLAQGSSSARDKSVAQARSLFGSLVLLVFSPTLGTSCGFGPLLGERIGTWLCGTVSLKLGIPDLGLQLGCAAAACLLHLLLGLQFLFCYIFLALKSAHPTNPGPGPRHPGWLDHPSSRHLELRTSRCFQCCCARTSRGFRTS